MTETPEVLVVGGGATGTGTLRDLTLRGVDAMLVDRAGLAGGTSGRSHGLLHSGARYAQQDPIGARDCIRENRTLRRIAGECIHETGGLFVQLADDDPAYFEEKRAACEEVGIDTSVISGETARERVPELSSDVVRALLVPDAVIYPSRLVAANAADAANRGAAVHSHAPVEEFTLTDGQITEVTIGGSVDEVIAPEYVVNATGPWAGQVASMAGVDVGMAPSRGVMIALEYDGLKPVLNRCRPPADGDIIVPHESEAVVGTTSIPVSDPDDYEHAEWEVEQSIAECATMLPPLAEAVTTREWWGVRPLYAPDETGEDRRGISRGFSVIDHTDAGVSNFVSVVGGKLTTYREMAEAVTDQLCDRLGVDVECETATTELLAAEDPDRLDEFVTTFGEPNPTDASVVSGD
jgi:Glycerol-3-phosphate dehydrogenase